MLGPDFVHGGSSHDSFDSRHLSPNYYRGGLCLTVKELAKFASFGYLFFLTALFVVVIAKLLVGTISLGGLLGGTRRDGSEYFSLGRTQLLISTILFAFNYVQQLLISAPSGSLPDTSEPALIALGGSQLFYLAGKARALWFDTSTQ